MSHKQLLSFADHLEILRRMLLRILCVAGACAIVVFCFKDAIFTMLLAPSRYDFCTYRFIESFCHFLGFDFHFAPFHVDFIATTLGSQFMTHLSTSFCLGALMASPYVICELYRFVAPALYEHERKYSTHLFSAVYLLFVIGLLLSYFILFPISFRFLGTYSVSPLVHTAITLDSYIETFTSLTLIMGCVFQLPVLAFVLAKMGILQASMLTRYRRHAFLLISLVAAIITPPDVMTLILVTIPLYLLYELSIRIVHASAR